jgi:hypothetical protein
MAENVSLDDFKNQINDIIKELEVNPNKINELTDEQVIEVDKYLNPYGATIYGDEKYTCISFTNLKEKYMQRLLTTGLVGFLYQMNKEYEIDDNDLNEEYKLELNKDLFYEDVDHPDSKNSDFLKKLEETLYVECKYTYLKTKYNEIEDKNQDENHDEEIFFKNYILSEDDELTIHTNTNHEIKERLKPTKYFNNERYLGKKYELIQKQSEIERSIITKFLNKHFKYDPSLHTSENINNNNDPEKIKPSNSTFIDNIPPNDTYGRFQYYFDVNYEEIRNSTLYLYNEKPDIEVAINIYESFPSLDECNEYINKNKDKVITNIMTLTNYKWNLLGPFKQNRERITFYNENTQILENILKQQEDDAKMGKKLLDDRIKKKKVKNIKEYGKTDPAVAKYLKENPTDISTNSHKVEILEDKVIITEEFEVSESGAKVDDDGTPEDAIEIGVTSINLKDNKVSTTKIYSKAHTPDMPKKQ